MWLMQFPSAPTKCNRSPSVHTTNTPIKFIQLLLRHHTQADVGITGAEVVLRMVRALVGVVVNKQVQGGGGACEEEKEAPVLN